MLSLDFLLDGLLILCLVLLIRLIFDLLLRHIVILILHLIFTLKFGLLAKVLLLNFGGF